MALAATGDARELMVGSTTAGWTSGSFHPASAN